MVNEEGEILMSGSTIKALGLPSSVTEKIKRVRDADKDPDHDVQMHLVPKEIIKKFFPSLAAIQCQYDQETRLGQTKSILYLNSGASDSGFRTPDNGPTMPSASGPPITLQPPAGAASAAPAPPAVETDALRRLCTEQTLLIGTLREEIRKNQETQERLMQRCSGQEAPGTVSRPPLSSSGPACTTEGPMPKLKPVPAAAVPKMRSKAPKAPAPQTGCAARRTVILPPLSRLNRAQLENLAVQWEVDPRGKTVAQIRDVLYELDKDMREGRRPVPGKST